MAGSRHISIQVLHQEDGDGDAMRRDVVTGRDVHAIFAIFACLCAKTRDVCKDAR